MVEDKEQPFAAYLRQIAAQLGPLTAEQRATIEAELRAHLEDVAAARGSDPTDILTQNSVIQALGPSTRLGRALAQSYRMRGDTSMQTTIGGRFWLLWVLCSIVGWGMVALPRVLGDNMWLFPLAGAMVGLLHVALAQRCIARDDWWHTGVLAFCGPWLAAAGLFWVLPWDSWMGQQSMLVAAGILGLIAIASGVAQLSVLRPYLAVPAPWVVVPFAALLLSLLATTFVAVNVLLPLGHAGQLSAIGGLAGAAVVINLLLGLFSGAVSGAVLVLLSHRSPVTQQLA